jgi:KH domain
VQSDGLMEDHSHQSDRNVLSYSSCDSAVLASTMSSSEVYAANASRLDPVLAAATTAFATVDCASDALLAITALLVSWQEATDTDSTQRVCAVLKETIALLGGSFDTVGHYTLDADASSASAVPADNQQLTNTATAAATETAKAPLHAARVAFDELDAICETLLSTIALQTYWTDSVIDNSRARVIAAMQATIALLLRPLSITSSSDCSNGHMVDDSKPSAVVAETIAAVQKTADVTLSSVAQSKISSADSHRRSRSTTDAAKAQTRTVSTQTNESSISYIQLQQQLNALTARLQQAESKRSCSDTASQNELQQLMSTDADAHQGYSNCKVIGPKAAATATVAQHSKSDADADDMRMRYEHERLVAKGYTATPKLRDTRRYTDSKSNAEVMVTNTELLQQQQQEQQKQQQQQQREVQHQQLLQQQEQQHRRDTIRDSLEHEQRRFEPPCRRSGADAIGILEITDPAVGVIMGENGDRLYALQKKFRVVVDVERNRGSAMRKVTITSSSADRVTAAAQEIEAMIDRHFSWSPRLKQMKIRL